MQAGDVEEGNMNWVDAEREENIKVLQVMPSINIGELESTKRSICVCALC